MSGKPVGLLYCVGQRKPLKRLSENRPFVKQYKREARRRRVIRGIWREELAEALRLAAINSKLADAYLARGDDQAAAYLNARSIAYASFARDCIAEGDL
jgi:hypothetical protein